MKSREERIREQERLFGVHEEVKESLMKIPGVVDVGVGLRQKAGEITDDIVFHVFVHEKKEAHLLRPEEIIPKEIMGIATDVLNVPQGKPRLDDSEHRPIKGGIQIGNGKGFGGTLGWFARMKKDNTLVILTNDHVLFDGDAKEGDLIGQPDVEKHCCCCCKYYNNVIGTIEGTSFNTVELDCGIATVNANIPVDYILNNSMITAEFFVQGTGVAAVGDAVMKIGSMSGLTHGIVFGVNAPASSRKNQMLIIPSSTETYVIKDAGKRAFSDSGDSGSVIINDANQIVALLWGGDSKLLPNVDTTFATDIQRVLAAFEKAGTPIELLNTPANRSAPVVNRNLSPRKLEHDMRDRLLQTLQGRLVVQLFDAHQKEILQLINQNKKVKVTWQRQQGPAYIAHVMNSYKDPDYRIPARVHEVSRQDLIIRMAAALRETGSEALQRDIEKYLVDVVQLTYELDSVEGFMGRMDEQKLA